MKLVIFAAMAVLALRLEAMEADATSAQTETQAAAIDSTQSFDFVSQINGESYEVSVYVPEGKAPPAGYPTLYLLDGEKVFGTFVNAISNEGFVHETEPAVVVGISGGPGETSAKRSFDFTPADLTDDEKKIVVDSGRNSRFGGYENFLRVIQEEIKPRVRDLATADRHRDILFGWSLGGQFVVHTMLTHPETFSSYAALSPSLWWANKRVFAEITDFEKKITASGQRVKLWLGVGSLEHEVSPGSSHLPMDQEKLAEELIYDKMVGNMLDFTAEVRPFCEKHDLPFSSRVFDGETHNTVPWAAVNPILRFALPGDQVKQSF
jgi:predicted alpha/beta superfamily hydrolase